MYKGEEGIKSDPWIISARSTADYFGSDRNDTLFSTNSPGIPKLDKEKNWLYTLDPILVTIIAMSSLGVLLGAICAGLLLYCTCSYAGLSSRSSTTLENYNFELYDGIKHKVKMNHQKCCSEAWWVPGDHPWHCARWGGLAGGYFFAVFYGNWMP